MSTDLTHFFPYSCPCCYICCPGFASFKHLWYMNPELFRLLINKYILINNDVSSPALYVEHGKSANHYSKHFPSIHSCQCPLARDHQKQTAGHHGKAKLALQWRKHPKLRWGGSIFLLPLCFFKDCSFLSDSYKKTPSTHLGSGTRSFPSFPLPWNTPDIAASFMINYVLIY